MTIPKQVKIAGYTYNVSNDKNLSRDYNANGMSCANDLTIQIDNSLPQQNQESTLLHEIIEQINYRYEFGLEHNKITILETALYQVIQDNKEIFL